MADLDDSVRHVWGPEIDVVEGAARFLTVHLDELVQTSAGAVVDLELTSFGLSRTPPATA